MKCANLCGCGWFFRKKKIKAPPRVVANWILLFGVTLIATAALLWFLSSGSLFVRVRYDNICDLKSYCKVPFVIESPVSAPLYFFLELTSFYQNHKKFLSSIPRAQLTGRVVSNYTTFRICREARYYGDFDIDDRERFPKDKIANPCGLMAKFFPQDIFVSLQVQDQLSISKTGKNLKTTKRQKQTTIAKKHTERKLRTSLAMPIINDGIGDPYFSELFSRSKTTEQWVDVEDGRFVNWMKTSSFSNFEKLWGVINAPVVLEPGSYYVTIFNRLNADFFSSEKYMVMRSGQMPIGSPLFWILCASWGLLLCFLSFIARACL